MAYKEREIDECAGLDKQISSGYARLRGGRNLFLGDLSRARDCVCVALARGRMMVSRSIAVVGCYFPL